MKLPGEEFGFGGADRWPAMGQGEEDCLHGWKEIAAYLRHGVRTVQRWEQKEGMPVHRHAHERRDAVYAYKRELDDWWRRSAFRLVQDATPPVPADLPADHEEPARRPGNWRPWLVLWVGVALVILAAGVWLAARSSSGIPFSANDWVVIADFDNQTGEAVLGRGLWMAFHVALQQSAHVNVVSRSRMERALFRMGRKDEEKIDESLGGEICLREGARLLIACSVARIGSQYVISARLVDPRTGEPVRAYLERASEQNQIITTIGRLTRRIRRDLGESLRSIQAESRPLPAVTTPSLAALENYAEGIRLWRKGKYSEALDRYKSALSHDPGFAMAHAALANAYVSHIFYEPALARSHFEKATQSTARITDRERLFIQASYHAHLNHVDEAVRFYGELLERYPADAAAHHNLGTFLMLNNRFEEAERHLREAHRLAPTEADTLINLASISRLVGRPRIALEQYALAFKLEPDWMTTGNINHEYGFGLVQAGDAAAARKVFLLAMAKPGMASRALRSLALLDMYEGRYRDAEARLHEAVARNVVDRDPLPEARNHLYLAILMEGRGDVSSEMRELRQALRAARSGPGLPVWLAARVGVRFAKAGALADAGLILSHGTSKADGANPKDLSELQLLEGAIAEARGQYDRAVAFFRAADGESSTPLTLAALAGALKQAGRAAEAIAAYRKLLERGHLALGWEPQQDWLAAHADLAELYLQQGDAVKSRQALAFLAALWSKADRDLPLAKRIEKLEHSLSGVHQPPRS